MPQALVFLSDSGADAEAARALKRRLLASPDAREAGLKVWLDKDDLRPGTPWSAQIADAATGHCLSTLLGHTEFVWSAAFSPDGTRVVTASLDNAARVWDVSAIPKGDILEVACMLLRMHHDPVSLEGVTDYPLTFDRPICVTDPPPPDLLAEAEAKEILR
jgi:WD40 repeat protein